VVFGPEGVYRALRSRRVRLLLGERDLIKLVWEIGDRMWEM
jgi:hypothetical protein